MQVEKLCSPATWAEGPVWLPALDGVVFSDVKGNRMYCWQRNGELSIWRHHSHYANGNARDHQGRVVSCEHGRRAISRTETDGTVNVLVDKVEASGLTRLTIWRSAPTAPSGLPIRLTGSSAIMRVTWLPAR